MSITPSTVAEYEQRAEEAERSPVPWILKAARVVVWIVYAIVLLTAINLLLAFFLRLFGASPDAAFVEWVYRNAEQAMRPFRGIFPSHELGGASVLDTSLLFAAICYVVLALLVDYLVHWLTRRLRRQEADVAKARYQADAAAHTYSAQQYDAQVAAQEAAAREFAAQQAAAQQYAVARAAAEEVVSQQQYQQQTTPSPHAPAGSPLAPPPAPPRTTCPRKRDRQAGFSYTTTWLVLSAVNGCRSQPAHRALRRKPASRAIRSSSDGHT